MTDAKGEPLDPVKKRLSSIEQEVGKLRVLEEANAQSIKLIWEGHGAKHDSHSAKLDAHERKLDKIIKALAPLRQIRDFIERVAGEHEQRLGDLEKRVGIRE